MRIITNPGITDTCVEPRHLQAFLNLSYICITIALLSIFHVAHQVLMKYYKSVRYIESILQQLSYYIDNKIYTKLVHSVLGTYIKLT